MRVEPQGFLRMAARFVEKRGLMIKPFVATLEYFSESGVSQRKSRIQRHCMSIALFGCDVVVARDLWPHLKLTAAEIHDVGVRIVGELRFNLRFFLRAELRRQGSRDLRRHLTLEPSNPSACDRSGPTRFAVRSLRRSTAHSPERDLRCDERYPRERLQLQAPVRSCGVCDRKDPDRTLPNPG